MNINRFLIIFQRRTIVAMLLISCTACSTLGLSSNTQSSSEKLREADTLYASGQLNGARALYAEIVDLHPEYSYAWFRLGNTSARQDSPEEAIAQYEEAVRLYGGDQRYWYNLALAHVQLAKKRAKTALDRNPYVDNSAIEQLISQIDQVGRP
jgi:tetratricopeptide (TPR) repeat protein